MKNDSYRQAYSDARLELAQALNARDELDRRIAKLRQTVHSLAQLCDEESFDEDALDAVGILLAQDMGLTEACLEVLRAADKELTGPEVKRGLEKMGFDLTKYENPLASIYPTLNRLAVKDKVMMEEKGGKKTYRLKSKWQ